jgi:hypothetical protein
MSVFCRNIKQQVRTTDKPRKTKYVILERKNSSKQNKIGHLKMKN